MTLLEHPADLAYDDEPEPWLDSEFEVPPPPPEPADNSAEAIADRRLAWVIGALVLAGFLLRIVALGERPMHHDESLDAWWSWRFRNGTYDGYNPVYHGPLRFYITAGFYEIFGESEFSARLFSALSGTAAIALPWIARRQIGRIAAGATAAALCISPTMLYYSRFAREDAQILFLTTLMMVVAAAYMHRPRPWHPMAFMLALACSFAIKESTYLFFLLTGGYALVVLAVQFDAIGAARPGRTRFHPTDPSAIAEMRFATTTKATSSSSSSSSNEPRQQSRAFAVAWPAVALCGLLLAVLVGERSDKLFPMLALYGAALTLVVVLLAVAASGRFWYALGVTAIWLGGIGLTAGALGFAIWSALVPDETAEGAANDAGWPWAPLLFLVLIVAVAAAATFASRAIVRAGVPVAPLFRRVGTVGGGNWALACGLFLLSFVTLFTVWFQLPEDWVSGVTEAVDYWDSQQEVNRGGQPWNYYLYALPAYEWLFVILAAVGTVRAVRRMNFATGMFVWFAVGNLILYSYAGERMPWLIVHPLLPMLFLAGMGVQSIAESWRRWWIKPVAVVFALGLIATTLTSLRASFVTDADGREILSQAGQATYHVTDVLDRLDRLDRITRVEQQRPVTLSISNRNSWPWAWYLRGREGMQWFDPTTSEPGDTDVIVADFATLDLDAYPDYVVADFALRSWWVPTYGEGGFGGWLGWVRGLELWEQEPQPLRPPLPPGSNERVAGKDAPGTVSLLRAGGAQVVDELGAQLFGSRDETVLGDPPTNLEDPDGRDGCGSVDQVILIRRDLFEAEMQVYPDLAPFDFDRLDCSSDRFEP